MSTRTSPLIRVRFRNPIRSTVSSGSSASTAGDSGASPTTASSSTSKAQGGCEGRRRRSADSASMSAEDAAGETGTAAMTTDDLSLEPRVRQYQKHELLQDRSPESGLSEVEAFLLEKQRLMELAGSSENVASIDSNKDKDDNHHSEKDKLEPRAPHYVPHPILQVKTETGLTELELYFQQKEAEVEKAANVAQSPPADATSS